MKLVRFKVKTLNFDGILVIAYVGIQIKRYL